MTALNLWERGERILMAANLVGSVLAGFAAVVLGTALARGLSQPETRPAAAASSGIEARGVEHFSPAPSGDDQAATAQVDIAGGTRRHRDPNHEGP